MVRLLAGLSYAAVYPAACLLVIRDQAPYGTLDLAVGLVDVTAVWLLGLYGYGRWVRARRKAGPVPAGAIERTQTREATPAAAGPRMTVDGWEITGRRMRKRTPAERTGR